MSMSLCESSCPVTAVCVAGVSYEMSEGVCRQRILLGEELWALPWASEIRNPFPSVGTQFSTQRATEPGHVSKSRRPLALTLVAQPGGGVPCLC